MRYSTRRFHSALVADTPALVDVDLDTFDALFLVGGQAPMYTFRNDQRVQELLGRFLADELVIDALGR